MKRAKKKGKKKVAKRKSARRGARKTPRRATAKKATKKPKPKKTKKPKKKGAKKPSKPKKKPPKHDTVKLSQPRGPDHVPHLSRSHKDKVRWQNLDVIDHTLDFTPGLWPFLPPQVSILVPAGGMTGWFTVDPNIQPGTYSYAITPPFPQQGPPDPPQVEIDP